MLCGWLHTTPQYAWHPIYMIFNHNPTMLSDDMHLTVPICRLLARLIVTVCASFMTRYEQYRVFAVQVQEAVIGRLKCVNKLDAVHGL